jgi:hypothetical protein
MALTRPAPDVREESHVPLSNDLLELLQIIGKHGLSGAHGRGVRFAIEEVTAAGEDLEPLSPDERREAEDAQDFFDRALAMIVLSRREPTIEVTDRVIKHLSEVLGEEGLDDSLNEFFTLQALGTVPRVVSRWKKLQTLTFGLMPGADITERMRQATTCYLFGLYDASAILCRAVLEFALEDVAPRPGGVRPLAGGSKDRYLKLLIDFAQNSRLLTPELAAAANQVRLLGNASAHKQRCGQADALRTVRETGLVLAHMYGRKVAIADRARS